eukprot:gnl/TRDRNA2_/TRDRNA2_135853_c1_seq1.p1 gnl/TRDRNA2_/TRDRNA2_135853_c1~~gnl/TRDRNA2_/TRDRNA2_135853_c1_seq1.p1  ORF type:complete len:344 (-),score=93.41 gnl/TRDRNA2_/TRDRNA2_135853_c1_seq1:41-1072(-)
MAPKAKKKEKADEKGGGDGGSGGMDMTGKALQDKDFTIGKTLGVGAFGRVRIATFKKTGNVYALKMLKKAPLIKNKKVENTLSEKAVLSSMKHPMVVNLYGSFHDKRYIYLLLEYCSGGEFCTYLRKANKFENDQAIFYAAQVASIFEYIHSKHIIYRDLKPENMLIMVDGYIKLTDFGFAKVCENRTYTLCGTPEYIAPEVLLNKGHGKAVDWWTLGILSYEMLVGYPPFVDEDPMRIYQKILAGKLAFPKTFDKHAKDLIKKLVIADLGKRLGNLRNGPLDVKQHKWFKDFKWEGLIEKKIPSPYKPTVKSEADTSNFEDYPDSTEQPAIVNAKTDPFADW